MRQKLLHSIYDMLVPRLGAFPNGFGHMYVAPRDCGFGLALVFLTISSNQVIAQMSPSAVENTQWRIYLLFCIMLILSIPFVYFFIPEVCEPPWSND